MTEPETYVDGCLNCERDTSDCHPVAYVYYGNYLCQLCCVELVEGFFEAFVKGGNRGAQGGKTMRLERERTWDRLRLAREELETLRKAAVGLLDTLNKHATGSFGESEDRLRELVLEDEAVI